MMPLESLYLNLEFHLLSSLMTLAMPRARASKTLFSNIDLLILPSFSIVSEVSVYQLVSSQNVSSRALTMLKH